MAAESAFIHMTEPPKEVDYLGSKHYKLETLQKTAALRLLMRQKEREEEKSQYCPYCHEPVSGQYKKIPGHADGVRVKVHKGQRYHFQVWEALLCVFVSLLVYSLLYGHWTCWLYVG